MDTITINVSAVDKELILTFEPKTERIEKIEIETAGDIDLSEYVKELTYLIGKRPKLVVNLYDTDDEKLTLIQNTIEDIAKSFNESIDEESEQVDDEDLF